MATPKVEHTPFPLFFNYRQYPFPLSFAQKLLMHLNFEFKARAANVTMLEEKLQLLHPRFAGEDHQIDTYFTVPHGRMKLRQGNIENALIHYVRENTASAKQSKVLLYKTDPAASLLSLLTTALDVKVVVDKKRRIYFIDNVKFHFDRVEGLGEFVEVEAIDLDGSIGIEKLTEQCNQFVALFGIGAQDFLAESYSDLLLAKKSSTN